MIRGARKRTRLPAASGWYAIVPWGVLAVSLLASVWCWQITEARMADAERARLDREVDRTTSAIEHELHGYIALLRGAQGLFAASKSVERDEWRAYVEALSLDEHYPGVHGLVYVACIDHEDLPDFFAETRFSGILDFTITPAGERETYYVITYEEPLQRNRRALGWDLRTIEPWTGALDKARDTGELVSTGKVRLRQEPGNQAGFVLYLPVYRNGASSETLDDRRAALLGWVGAQFRAGDLMQGILRNISTGVDVAVYDGEGTSADRLLHLRDADPADAGRGRLAALSRTRTIVVGDGIWTLGLTPNARFHAAGPGSAPVTVLLLAAGVSLLLFGTVWMATSRARATAIAQAISEDLRESEERFRSLSASSPIGIFRADAEGKCIYANERWEQISGLSLEETLGEGWQRAIHPEDRPRILEEWAAFVNAPDDYRTEARIVSTTGQVRWVHTRARPIQSPDDGLTGFVGIVEDITDRKRSEEKMLGLVRAIESSADAIYITDEAGTIVYANPAFTRITGWSTSEVLGKHLLSFSGSSLPATTHEIVWERLKQEGVFSGRLLNRRARSTERSGTPPLEGAEESIYWAQLTISSITGDSGTLLGYVAVQRDVTEEVRREQRQALERNQTATRASIAKLLQEQRPLDQRLGDALSAILSMEGARLLDRAAVFVQDRGSDRLDLRVERGAVASDFFLRMPSLVPGRRGEDVRVWNRCACDQERLGSGEEPARHGHYAVALRHGSEVKGALVLFAESPPRRDPSFLEMLRTIGELIGLAVANDELQREMQLARETAQEATRAKSEFLANMSHEIRTPMTAILGYADLLLEPDRLESDVVEFVETIRRNGAHLMSIINNILDLSKIEAGKMMVERIECSPCQVVREVASLMRGRAVEKNLGFGVEFVGPIPETIWSDPTRLRQILLNLTSNAIKFTVRGGVKIVTSLLDPPGAPDPRLGFSVIDTGVGLSAEHQAKLFSPFSQADTSTTRKFGGTGLGLTISRRLAEMLNGEVSVESAPGRGSTFTLSLRTGPLAGIRLIEGASEAAVRERSVAQADAERREERLSGRVLIAEDGPDNQRLISVHLRRAGADVEIAENGRVAVEAVIAAEQSGRPFDCILMDMQMPEVDGYMATARLRTLGYTRPILALTAHAMAGDREKCLQAGCDDYVPKPIDRDLLLRLVARALARKEAGADAPRPSAAPAPAAPAAGQDTLAADPVMKELAAVFVAALPERLAAIDSALTRGDVKVVERVAHQLKGAAGGYGFLAITEKAAVLEREASRGASEATLRRAFEDLASLCRRAQGSSPGEVPVA